MHMSSGVQGGKGGDTCLSIIMYELTNDVRSDETVMIL